MALFASYSVHAAYELEHCRQQVDFHIADGLLFQPFFDPFCTFSDGGLQRVPGPHEPSMTNFCSAKTEQLFGMHLENCYQRAGSHSTWLQEVGRAL